MQHGHNLCLRKQKEEEIGIDQNTACSQHQNSSERPNSYNYASDTSLRQEIPQPMQSPVSETPKTAHEERDASSDSGYSNFSPRRWPEDGVTGIKGTYESHCDNVVVQKQNAQRPPNNRVFFGQTVLCKQKTIF